jgi:lysophospholipase L1-like esterase
MKKKLLLFLFIGIFSSFSPKKITWVAIGDSITYLNDHPNETGNRITKGYMTRIVEKLPEFEYINQGHNGWTSVRIAEKIETLGLAKADVYSVFLGTNDWWSGQALGTFADYQNNTGNTTVYGSFKIIINKLRSLNPDAKIILITPMQRVDFVYITNMKNNAYGSYREKKGQQLAQFAEAINAIGKYENINVVDLYHNKKLSLEKLVNFKRLKDPQTGEYRNYPYPAFVDVPFNPETDEYPYPLEAIRMTYDGLHPSDEGYEVITKKLLKVMKKVSSSF